MHPFGYNEVPTEAHSAPIFTVRQPIREEPKTMKLSLDQLHPKHQKGDSKREMHGAQEENSKGMKNVPVTRVKATYDALPIGIPQNTDKDLTKVVRKSPSCLSVKLLKNAVKRTYHPVDKSKPLHPNKSSSISLRSIHPPKPSRSAIPNHDNARLIRLHSKLSCISNERKSVVTSSTSRSDDQIVLHSTKRFLQKPTYLPQYNTKHQNKKPITCGLKHRNSSSLSVCSHTTELAMIIPEISVETNLNCTARSEAQQSTNRSMQSTPKVKLIKATDDEEKPICISQHSIRLRSHDTHKPAVDFGRRMQVPRADLSRIRISEAPGLKALDQTTVRPCELKRKVLKEVRENLKVGQVSPPSAKSSISYMFLYMSILCGIGLMMIAYYL